MKTLLAIRNFASELGVEDLPTLKSVVEFAKGLRPSMPVIRNVVLKLERFLSETPEFRKDDFLSFIDTVICDMEAKRRKVVEIGRVLLKDVKSVGVVSYSSNIMAVISENRWKIFAMESDEFAGRFGENVIRVSEEMIEEKIDVGLMGADAIVVGDTVRLVNGYPSARFVEAVRCKKIFVFAECEKLVRDDDYRLSESGLEILNVRSNMILLLV